MNSRVKAGVLLALFVAMLGMAICPTLHECVHEDAGDHEHSCAVTMLLSEGVDVMPSGVFIEWIPLGIAGDGSTEALRVAPFFISCFVPDHSPPPVS